MFDFLIDIVAMPLGFIMKLIYDLVGNYGIAIILFTLVTKLILFPISYKQQKNSARLQLINPKLAKLRQKYKDKPEKYQEEQMRLYQEENINPWASCLPSMLSLILLWGVLAVVYEPMTYIMDYDKTTISTASSITLELNPDAEKELKGGMREQLVIMESVLKNQEVFAEKMEATDSAFVPAVIEFADTFRLGNTDLSQTPSFKFKENSSVFLFLIPILSGVVQLAMTIYMQHMQKKRNPDMPSMGAMNLMLYFMPIFSIWLAFSVPAGVGFYWLCSSGFSFLQSIFLYAWFNDKRVEKIGEAERKKAQNAKRRPSLMQKMLEQQEEMMRQQQQNGGSNSGRSSGASNRVRYSDGDEPVKLSRSELEEFNTAVIRDARRRMAEKYGDNSDKE